MIYLDHAASTSLRPTVVDYLNLEKSLPGNPSSSHTAGQWARAELEQARLVVGECLHVQSDTVVFTSGGTESLHLGIVGSYLALEKPYKRILVSPLGHSSVKMAVNFLTQHFGVEVVFLPLNDEQQFDLEVVPEILEKGIDLVVAELQNSETGHFQGVSRLGKVLQNWSKDQEKPKPVFVVDACSGVVTKPLGLDYQKCDALAISGEKFGALPGSGVLLKSSQLKLEPLIGGSQEQGLRGGTENVLGAQSLALGLKNLQAQQTAEVSHYKKLQSVVRNFFAQNFPHITISSPESAGHIFHFILPEGQPTATLFVAQADLLGLALSAGSACSSGSVGGSQILKKLDYTSSQTERGVRLSFGWSTSKEDLGASLETLKKLLKQS